MKVRNTYTAIIKKGEQGYYFGWIEEVPEAMSQGATINELLENLKDALSLVLEDKKTEAVKITIGQKVTRLKIVWPCGIFFPV